MEIEFMYPREFQKWSKRLGKFEWADIARRLDLLQHEGLALGMPNIRRLSRDLWELRSSKYRLYFTVDNDTALIVLVGDKDSQQRDIQLAKERLK